MQHGHLVSRCWGEPGVSNIYLSNIYLGKLYKLVSELSKCGPRLNMYLAQDILHILVPPVPVPNIIYNLNSTGRGS